MKESSTGIHWSVLFFLCLLILWQLLVPYLGIPRYLLPTPWGIVEEFGKRGGLVLSHGLTTFYETILGFLIGIVVGVGSGLGVVYSRFLWLTIYPSLVVIGSIPRIAIADEKAENRLVEGCEAVRQNQPPPLSKLLHDVPRRRKKVPGYIQIRDKKLPENKKAEEEKG